MNTEILINGLILFSVSILPLILAEFHIRQNEKYHNKKETK